MDTLGTHLLVEYFGCNPLILDDQAAIERLMADAAVAAEATPLKLEFHRFSPHGVTGVVIVAESHLSIHTWPEHGYASVDFYTCGTCSPHSARELLHTGLGAQSHDVLEVTRGLNPFGRAGIRSMRPTAISTEPVTPNLDSTETSSGVGGVA